MSQVNRRTTSDEMMITNKRQSKVIILMGVTLSISFIIFTAMLSFFTAKFISKDSKHTVFDNRTNAFVKVTSSKDEMGFREKLIVPTIKSYISSREGSGQSDQLDRYRCVVWMSEGKHLDFFKNKLKNEASEFKNQNLNKTVKILRTWLLSAEEGVWQTDFDVLYNIDNGETNVSKASARVTYEWRDQLLTAEALEDNDYFICNPGGMMITGYKVQARKDS